MPHKQDQAYAYQRNFGRRLRACRQAAGYDGYQDFAKAVGLQSETYRTYETGDRQPKFHVLAKIAEKLNKSLDFLILGKSDE
jgi:transcriptional regulator with XRE-family HTH domain